MRNIGRVFAILMLTFSWSACDRNEENPESEYEYFPLKLNSRYVYQLNETRYSAGNKEPKTTQWFEKDEVIREDVSLDGFPVFVFSRSRRNSTIDSWQKVKEYTVTRYPEKYLLTIDDVTTMPMVFPIRNTESWDINKYNTKGWEDCYYAYIGREDTVGELSFGKTLKVQGRYSTDDDVVSYNNGYSKYAAGVGLVFDEQTDYEYCQESEACLGKREIVSGLSTIRQLIEFEVP